MTQAVVLNKNRKSNSFRCNITETYSTVVDGPRRPSGYPRGFAEFIHCLFAKQSGKDRFFVVSIKYH